MLELLRLMVSEYHSNPDKSKTENVVGILRQAYEKSLKRHHNFVAKQLFKVKFGQKYICVVYVTQHYRFKEKFQRRAAGGSYGK